MATIPQIREQAGLIPDPDIREVCARIIDEVVQRSERKNLGMWTFDVISKWVGRESGDLTVMRSVQHLASSPNARLLAMHFVFVDPSDEDSPGEIVEDEEVRAAFESGYFIHPVTGQKIVDFDDLLLPYFEPAPDLGAK